MKDLDPIIVNIKYENIEDTSEKLLAKILELHFKTVFVGAVFHIENEFGHLWGESEDFDESKLTEDQKIMYEKFLNLRNRIFDQGNKEKKAAISKLKSFDITLRNNRHG
jgi:hypothetical protein